MMSMFSFLIWHHMLCIFHIAINYVPFYVSLLFYPAVCTINVGILQSLTCSKPFSFDILSFSL